MSTTDVLTKPRVVSTPRAKTASRAQRGHWIGVALVCAALLASGAVRRWQARRVSDVLHDGWSSPFALETLPMALGNWRGESTTLDPKIARRTGATDLITRRYVDQRTGATLEAIILYGPSIEVFGHNPEVCYPTAGYERHAGPDLRTIHAGRLDAPFRSLVYTKGEGGQTELQEVYYSWRPSQRWTLELGTYKQLERLGGMLKVQLARPVSEHERRDVGNPCEAFLEVLIPEIERRLAESQSLPRHTPEGPAR